MDKEKNSNRIVGMLAALASAGVLYALSFVAIMILLFLLAELLKTMGIDTQCGDNHSIPYPSFCQIWNFMSILPLISTGLIVGLVYYKTGGERFLSTIWRKVFPLAAGIFILANLVVFLLMKYAQ